MATVVTRLNAGINFFTDLIGYTIRINYVLGEALFTLLSWAFGHVSTGTRAVLALIRVALFDFGQFVEDVGNVLASILLGLELLANFVAQFIYNIFYAFLSALASFVAVVIGVGTAVYVTLSSVLAAGKHLLQVGGKSFILVVQTLPLSLAEGCRQATRFVTDTCQQGAAVIVDSCTSGYDGIKNQVLNVRNLFKGLPGEAYLGVTLLLLIILGCHYALRLLYVHRTVILHKAYQLSLNILSAVRHGGARLSWNAEANRGNVGMLLENDGDESPSSSLDSTPPYNLRLRKPGQRACRASRIEDIRLKLQREKESRLCVICADRTRSVVLLPCRHFSFCDPCIAQAVKYHHHCPVCRQGIEDIVTVYQ